MCVAVPAGSLLCREFVSLVLCHFSMAIVLSWIACVFIDGRFASARMASTGVVQSWQVVARPAWRCDL